MNWVRLQRVREPYPNIEEPKTVPTILCDPKINGAGIRTARRPFPLAEANTASTLLDGGCASRLACRTLYPS